MTDSPNEVLLEQVQRLRLRTHRAARAQYLASKRTRTQHLGLGIPAIVLSAIIGSSIFGSLAGNPATVFVILTGLASLLVAVLAALQTFFGFEERSRQHRAAGARYGALKRKLDVLALSIETSAIDGPTAMSEYQDRIEELNGIEAEVPDPPDRFYDRARREQEHDAEGA